MAGSSCIPEKSLPEGEGEPTSCPIDLRSDDVSSKVLINDSGSMNHMDGVQKVPDGEDEDDEDDEEYGDDPSEDELLAQMGYEKSEPEKFIEKEYQEQHCDDDDEDDAEEYDDMLEESLLAQLGYQKKEALKHEPVTTPTAALKLVSALKGSREKEGKQAAECHVSWAPDVYDPLSSTEHISTTSAQRNKNEAHKVKGLAGKNKQKMGGKGPGGLGGGGSKGSKVGGSKGAVGGGGKAGVRHKDKKQVKKKHGGSGSASKYSNLYDC